MMIPPIRKVLPREARRLAAFGGRLFWEAYYEIGDPEKIQAYIEQHYTPHRFGQILAEENTHLYLWEEQQDWCGYVMLTLDVALPDHEPQAARAAKVNLLYVDRRHQGRGIGNQLLQVAEAAARDAGCRMLWLTVWPIAQAPAFYRKMGWEQIGEIPFVYPDGTADLDWIMAKSIDSSVEEKPGEDPRKGKKK